MKNHYRTSVNYIVMFYKINYFRVNGNKSLYKLFKRQLYIASNEYNSAIIKNWSNSAGLIELIKYKNSTH